MTPSLSTPLPTAPAAALLPDAAALPCGAFELSTDGIVTAPNAALLRMLGRPAEEVDGVRVHALLSPLSGVFFDMGVVPQLRLNGAVHEIALSLQQRDGSHLPVLLYATAHAHAHAHADVHGPAAPARFHAIVVSVQDRSRIEAELQSIRQAVEQVPGVVFRLDMHPLARARFGYLSGDMLARFGARREHLQRSARVALRPVQRDERAALLRSLAHSAARLSPWWAEFRLKAPAGREIWLRVQAQPRHDGQGGVVWFGHISDISQRKAAELALAESHERLRVTLQSIGDAVITTDAKARVQWLNPVAERLTGWSTAEALGRPLGEVFHRVHQDTRQPLPDPVRGCLAGHEVAASPAPALLINRAGLEFGIEDSASPIRSDGGAPPGDAGGVLGAVLVFRDVTETRRLNGEMHYRATHDPLTGLLNRSEFDVQLAQLLSQVLAEDAGHALLYIDLDQFKLVNDTCGHAVGDVLLQQVSALLIECVRERDVLARLGGDEFAVVLRHCNTAQAQHIAQKICDRMEGMRFLHEERRFRIGASIGLVPLDARWPHTEPLVQAADEACYAAKQAGRNRVHAWHDDDPVSHMRQGQTQWASRLEQALDDDRFELLGQRIVPLNGETEGLHCEVLLRLREADGTLVTPGAFLPAAERFHMATRIDRWVLRHTLAWLAAQPSLEGLGRLCINLSGQSIGDRAFHAYAAQALAASTIDLRKLCFDITETAAITHLADAAAFIERMRSMGLRIALDDFGAGAASFGHLKALRVDALKIDGQFIRDLVTDRLDAAAVRCFHEVAQVMGVQTVAESVETPAALDALREIGVTYAQGFAIHRPEPLQVVFDAAHAAPSAGVTALEPPRPGCAAARPS